MPDILHTEKLLPDPLVLNLAQANWDNGEVSIPVYGFGILLDFPGEINLAVGVNGDGEISIPAITIDPPTNAYGAHVGQGTILMHWQHVALAKVDYFEIYASESIGGQYIKYQQGEFPNLRGIVNNVPMGVSVYLKVRAVGKNRAVSAFVPVRQGKLAKPLVTMNVTAIEGSRILAGAIFVANDQDTGALIAIAAEGLIVIN